MSTGKPAFLAYSSTSNVIEYAGPGAVFVAGPGNWMAPEFQAARDLGSLLLTYARPITLVNWDLSPLELEFYMGDKSAVPVWGNGRQNNSYGVLTDIRVGSKWADHLVNAWMPDVIESKKTDGLMLDVLGARPWGAPKVGEAWKRFDDWPGAERAEWTAGAVDLMRRLHEVRLQMNPAFRLVCNNVWFLPPADPSRSLAASGANNCDGIMLEHALATSPFHIAQASRTYSDPARRIVIAMTHTPAEAHDWMSISGVTHVTAIDTRTKDAAGKPVQSYNEATPPVVGYEPLDWRTLVERLIVERDAAKNDERIAELSAQIQALQAEAEKSRDRLVNAWQLTSNAAAAIRESIG